MQKEYYKNIDETLISETLPNGLKINIIQKPQFSKSFAMFATNYGGADRRFKLAGEWIDTPAGVAHYLEHKMFDMPDGNALNALSSRGASPNAFTSSEITAYHFESTTMFDENLRTLLSFVSTPYFTVESVQKEQGIIGQEIRMVEDTPGYVLYYNLLKCLYSTNPVRDSVAGTVESIAEITHETLYHCHKVFYNPSNMALAVVGNVDPEKVINAARELLPSEPGEIPESDYGQEDSPTPKQSKITAAMEVSAPQFLFGAKLVPEQKGKARLNQMLTGEIALRLLFGPSSLFYTRLYAEGLINGSFDYELDYTAGTAMIVAGGESRNVDGVMNELNAEIAKIAAEGLNKTLFENARKSFFGSQLRILGSFSAVSQTLINGIFSDYRPLDTFEEINRIKLEDVQNFILNNLTSEKLALSVVSPLER